MRMELWVINVNVNFQLISKLLMREWSHLIQYFSVRPHNDLRCYIPLVLWWCWLHLWQSWRCQYLFPVWARDSHYSYILGETSCYFLLLKIPSFWNAQRPSMTQVLVLVCPSSTISSDRVDAPPCQQEMVHQANNLVWKYYQHVTLTTTDENSPRTPHLSTRLKRWFAKSTISSRILPTCRHH